jgi:methylated-DNA-[protein]-cysteine S-methyltransferase
LTRALRTLKVMTTATIKHVKAIHAGRVLSTMTFNEKVWALTSRIPRGRVTTYAALASALGSRAYRAVGLAMNRNPFAPRVPCHRVVGSDGRLVGYAGGLAKKLQMLQREGFAVVGGRVDLNSHQFHFKAKAL